MRRNRGIEDYFGCSQRLRRINEKGVKFDDWNMRGKELGLNAEGDGLTEDNYGSWKIICLMELKGDIMEALMDDDATRRS